MYDIIVIGGGHAGVEASLAAARLNNKTLLILGNKNKVAYLACNPSIGGPAKGILVREIDALGGEMAKCSDSACLQMKMLNSSKGPAVRALRAQADKIVYPKNMLAVLEQEKNLTILEDTVLSLIKKDTSILGVRLKNLDIYCQAVIICTGTYMNSNVLVGHSSIECGPDNEKTSKALSENLINLGFKLIRLKTGTPPRILKSSVDYNNLKIEPGDNYLYTFSNLTKKIRSFEKQLPCYLTHTTLETKKIILENLEKSSMYGGIVTGVGPRYCPSIEDKIKRFEDKDTHQIFLEPESEFSDDIYIQGLSTSFPHDIQEKLVRSVVGLEKAVITKYAYAIEYDAIDPLQLKHNLESKIVNNLFFAGQVNGTSGYEEAAAQGLIAGINASLKIKNQKPLVLRRDEAYIGVLIDDLILKGVNDPYRLLTSRAEFRLLLRHDNADERLIKYGYEIGLITEDRYNQFLEKQKKLDNLCSFLKSCKLYPKNELNKYLESLNKPVLNEVVSAYGFLKRPNVDIFDVIYYLDNISQTEHQLLDYQDYFEKSLIEIKYSGYINKEYKEVEKMKQMEERKIPLDFDYRKVKNLAKEAIDKLEKIRPYTLGQASRISGVNPNDINMLLIYLESYKHVR